MSKWAQKCITFILLILFPSKALQYYGDCVSEEEVPAWTCDRVSSYFPEDESVEDCQVSFCGEEECNDFMGRIKQCPEQNRTGTTRFSPWF